MMTGDNDERITAWLDGQMSGADAAAFEAELESDEALAEEVARLTENDARLKAAIPEVPVNDAMLAKLGLRNADVVDFAAAKAARDQRMRPNAPSAMTRWRWPAVGAALAASLVIVMVSKGPSGLEGQTSFQIAMTVTPSGSSRAIGDGRTATPRLSFAAGDGRYCREFSLTGQGKPQSGIACRADARWTIEAIVNGGDRSPAPDGIRTAGGDDTTALDAAYQRLAAKDPISGDDEKRLILKGWK